MSSKRIYVGNLPHVTSEEEVRREFEKFGNIDKIDLKQGYGFVEYEHLRDADDAIHQMDRKEFGGRMLRVEHTRGAPRSSGGSRGGRPPRGGSPHRERRERRESNGYRVEIFNLKGDVSWQNLKDEFRKFGDVIFADVSKERGVGVVEFAHHDDMRKAVRKFDGADLLGSVVTLKELSGRRPPSRYSPYSNRRGNNDGYRGSRRRSYSGSPRRRYSRSPQPYRSRHRSHDSRSPKRYSRSPVAKRSSNRSQSPPAKRERVSKSPRRSISPVAASNGKKLSPGQQSPGQRSPPPASPRAETHNN